MGSNRGRSGDLRLAMSREGASFDASRWLVPTLLIAFSTLLAACDMFGGSDCPVDDRSFCEFVEEIEPLVEGLDSSGVYQRSALECCKQDFTWPDSTGFDPDAPCLRSGAYLGEGSCLVEEELTSFLIRLAPLSIDFLIDTKAVFSELPIKMGDTAILARTGDPESYLAILAQQEAGRWQITAIVEVSTSILAELPEDAFIFWPPYLETPNPPPESPGAVG